MNSDSNQGAKKRGGHALIGLVGVALAGLGLILVFSYHTSSPLSVFSVACMFATASILAGGLFGFLFGIPRTLQQQRDGEEIGTGKPSVEGEPQTYAPNTNLEQISDWLTKILVGAGLIQLGKLRELLRDSATSLAPGFGGGESGRVFSLATVLSYVFLGFLISYLWTRLYFAGALRAVDVEGLRREIKEIRQQSDVDAKALGLALRQLNPSTEVPAPAQQELNDAIRDASKAVKAQIFYQAQTLRAENWSEPRTKAKMERTIPIFRALINSDVDDEYHSNHGQLGYALKDSRNPDWKDAESELTKAIQIRGPWREYGWIYYEFNRAICRIMIDDPIQAKPSPQAVRKAIIEDLQAVFSHDQFIEMADRTPEIMKWIEVNKVTPSKLSSPDS